jgi:hypothetical protein
LNERRLAGVSILVAGLIFFTKQVFADSWQSAVAYKASTEFDTNPLLSPDYSGGVWRDTYVPGYLLSGTDGANQYKAGVGVQIERSSDPDQSPNRNNRNLHLGWLRQGEVNTVGISANYYEMDIRNGGVNVSSPGLSAAPTAAADATVQGVNGTRTSRSASANWSRALTERNKVSLDESYDRVSYVDAPLPFVNYTLQKTGLRYQYELTEGSTPFVYASQDRYVPTYGGPPIRLATGLVGADLKTETATLTFQSGVYRDSQENSAVHNTGVLGSVETHYKGERNQFSVIVGHMVWPSGLGGFAKTDQKKVGWIYALSEDTNAGIDLEKDNYHYLEAVNLPDSTASTAGVWMERDLNFSWKMRTYYEHRTYRQLGLAGGFSNLIGISFAYVNPDF